MSYYRNYSSNYYRPSLFGGFQFFPPVIKSLLIANVAIYFFMSFFGMFHIGGVSLATIIGTYFPLYPFGDHFQVWQLFTYMFMPRKNVRIFPVGL